MNRTTIIIISTILGLGACISSQSPRHTSPLDPQLYLLDTLKLKGVTYSYFVGNRKLDKLVNKDTYHILRVPSMTVFIPDSILKQQESHFFKRDFIDEAYMLYFLNPDDFIYLLKHPSKGTTIYPKLHLKDNDRSLYLYEMDSAYKNPKGGGVVRNKVAGEFLIGLIDSRRLREYNPLFHQRRFPIKEHKYIRVITPNVFYKRAEED